MCRCDFDLPAKQRELDDLREASQAPDLWNDRADAQRVMRGVARLEGLLTTWQNLEAHSADVQALLELAQERCKELEIEITYKELT